MASACHAMLAALLLLIGVAMAVSAPGFKYRDQDRMFDASTSALPAVLGS
jgi:hypothetical protein